MNVFILSFFIGPQGALCWLLPARVLCSSLPFSCLHTSERSRMDRGGSGSGFGFLRPPVAQSGPQHGSCSPVRLLSASRTLRLALSRDAHSPDSLPRAVFSVLLPDCVSVCRECNRGRRRRGPQPPVTSGTEGWHKRFFSSDFSTCCRRTYEISSKGVVVNRLLAFNKSPQQVSVGCDRPINV